MENMMNRRQNREFLDRIEFFKNWQCVSDVIVGEIVGLVCFESNCWVVVNQKAKSTVKN